MNKKHQNDIEFFNLRVYALIIENEMILLSKELIKGEIAIKFPGGGVEPGEGIIDALQREGMEELEQNLNNIEHFYTTDFFQQSSFNPKDQLISVYYKASLSTNLITNENTEPIPDQPVFIWKKLSTLNPTDLHFPIDRHVLNLIQKQ